MAINGEGDGGEVLNTLAVGSDLDAIDERLDELLLGNEEGSSGVDNSHVSIRVDGGGSLSDGVELEGPVLLLNDLMGLNDGVVLGVHAGHDHVGLLRGVLEVEREGFILKVGFVNEGILVVNRDAAVAETEDSAHLRGKEAHARDGGDLTEAHRGSDVTANSGNVSGEGTLDGSRSVGDVEGLTVLLVGARLRAIESRMGPAWDSPARVGVDPEVGRSSIGNDGELLTRGTNLNINEVLSVHVVFNINVLTTKELVLEAKLLSVDHIKGEGLVVHVNSTGGDESEESSDGEFHFKLSRTLR